MIKADPVYCENVTLKYVCGIVYMDELGNIEQSQFPALGLTHWEEGCGVCLDLTGFCLYGEDVGYLDDIHAVIDKCDPCAVYQALCDCKLNLALNKDDKAGISFMDTSVTFRKTDTQLLLDLEAEYREKCMKKCNPSHNSRRFRQPMRCR